SKGKVLEDLSVDVGETVSTSPLLFSNSGSIGFNVATQSGLLRAWEYTSAYNGLNTLWQGFSKDAGHSNFAVPYSGNTSGLSSGFLPRDRVYNWPNPVYGNTTNVRYYVSENADVSIRIFDLAGAQVAEILGKAQAGVDGEVPWDVSNIQSGIYLARIEAVGTSKTEVAVIKIAVVK
ncbi:MAG: T9SS type A sorting domain-containing protein, partial [Bacteroidota bacterium]